MVQVDDNRDTHPPLYKLRQCAHLLRSLRLLWLGQGRGLRATHTTADTHVRRPHVLKLEIQDLWDASDTKKNSLCTSRGPHVLRMENVTTNPCLMWPHYISYVIKLHTYSPYAYCSLDKGVAYKGGRGVGGQTNRWA